MIVEAATPRPFEPAEGRQKDGRPVLAGRPDPEHLAEEARAYVADPS